MTPDLGRRDSSLHGSEDPDMDIKGTGLRGIQVATTGICLIEGEEGNLLYRGYSIEDLAENSTYEEIVYLLLLGDLPTSPELEDFNSALASNREIPQEIIDQLQRTPKSALPMNVLQSAVGLLASFDPELAEESKDAKYRKAIRIIVKMPTIVAAWERIRKNQAPIGPDSSLSLAANFLYMLTGKKPASDIAKWFDVALILHAEHSFNASTFTARVIASTGADLYAAISGAISSLSGKLHGGAATHVMRNLLEIGDVANVEGWVKTQFDSGKRIMGMGHAVYKVMDPRAKILRGMTEQFIREDAEDIGKWFSITNKIVEVTQKEFMKRKGRQIYPNIDLYSPCVFAALGISMEAFSTIFALSRAAGWAAHALEEQFPDLPGVKPVLYRPSADYAGLYCGPLGCEFTPLEEREPELIDPEIVRRLVIEELQKVRYEPQKSRLLNKRAQDTKTSKINLEGAVQQIGGASKSQQKKLRFEKDLITEADVEDLGRNGIKELYLAVGTIITPLAKDRARELDIEIIIK